MNRVLLVALVALSLVPKSFADPATNAAVSKVRDFVIYQDDKYYSTFPSIVRRRDGELLVAFRRAPNRRLWGEKGFTHTDANSQLVLVRSEDEGKSWSAPELLFAHPQGGSQDPCMVQLRDGTIICASYGWAHVSTNYSAKLTNTVVHTGGYAFMGGYLLKSKDGGHSWRGPITGPPVATNPDRDVFNQPVAPFNRGAMCEGRDGNLYWVVAASAPNKPRRTETHLLISSDKGETWKYSCPVATDPKITFNETSIYETPKGDLVAFTRTANFDDHTVIARSSDHGKTFQWQDSGFQGHPHYALRLPDNRVLLVYGYRHVPYGIRARVLNAECTDFATAPEIVLRDDGGSYDIGYPWATMLSKDRALVVYYLNHKDGDRFIAGTLLDVKKLK